MASSAELAGRVALVTGASGGIGRATARRLAAAGARLWLVARGRQRLEALASELKAEDDAHDAIRIVACDVAVAEAVDGLRQRVEDEAPPDILIHAAGGFELARVEHTEPAMLERMIAGNLRAPFLVTRAFLNGMLRRGTGDIVTIGSVAGRHAFPENGAYSASKFGVRGFHAVLDEELRGTGVRATLVEPAATDTPIWDPIDPDNQPGLPPRNAMLSPESVADTILHVLTRPRDVRIPAVAVQRS